MAELQKQVGKRVVDLLDGWAATAHEQAKVRPGCSASVRKAPPSPPTTPGCSILAIGVVTWGRLMFR
jgi:hypothetical protein